MHRQRQWLRSFSAVAGLLIASGCGGGAGDSATPTAEAKVTGTVKVHGTPMHGGEITFVPPSSGGQAAPSRTAPVKDDGSFVLTAAVGRNQARVSGPALKNDPTLGYVIKNVDVEPSGSSVQLDFP